MMDKHSSPKNYWIIGSILFVILFCFCCICALGAFMVPGMGVVALGLANAQSRSSQRTITPPPDLNDASLEEIRYLENAVYIQDGCNQALYHLTIIMNNTPKSLSNMNEYLDKEYESAFDQFIDHCSALGNISDEVPPRFSNADSAYKKAAAEVPVLIDHFRAYRRNNSIIEYLELLHHHWVFRENVIKGGHELQDSLPRKTPDALE